MKRQASILSFLKKPSPGDQRSGGHQAAPLQRNKTAPPPTKLEAPPTNLDFTEEIRSIETPPEKVPRQIFPTNDDDVGTKPSIFASIKHKFIKFDGGLKSSDRSLRNGGSLKMSSASCGSERSEVHVDAPLGKLLTKENAEGFKKTVMQGDNRNSFVIDTNDDVLEPETPDTRPLVPRFKRVHDDAFSLPDKGECSALNMNKRVRTQKDFVGVCKSLNMESETTSKFEWLHPSQIRDANCRRPSDPLFDKTTLYIPPDALRKMSATQKQYWEVKCRYMDVVLFFKVGKFYELYELDADIGHKELDWKITLSGVGKCRQVGIPEGGIDDAVQKLLALGYKVGRMEQLETSEQAKFRGSTSVIQRKLVNVLTPATTSEGNIGHDAVHLLSVVEGRLGSENGSTSFGFAFVDCAALKIWVGSISDDASCAALAALLMQISPKEVIYESHGLSKEAHKALKTYSLSGTAAPQLTAIQPESNLVDPSEVKNLIQLKGYFEGSFNRWDHVFDGVVHHDLALCAFGGLASHLERLMLGDALRNGDILPYEVYQGFLRMDGQTLVNLEIFNNSADGGPSGTLYKYLDNCITSSGKRILRRWVCHPLKDVDTINIRLNVVEHLMTCSETMSSAAQYLRKLPDIERLLGRVKASIKCPAELLLPTIGKKRLKERVKVFGSLVKGMRIGMDLLMLLWKDENLSSLLSKVFSLPVLVGTVGLSKFLAQFEAAIDSDFPKYQDHEIAETDAETLSILMELFIEKAKEWSQVINAIGCVDVLRSFAITATLSNGTMCRPMLLPISESRHEGPVLEMKGLWHPYALSGDTCGMPVPNDLQLGGGETGQRNGHTLLLTGPNMGGKSTLLRATCLAVIMAQMGCYAACEALTLSLVDTIFTRLGATDRIMMGESTFFIECMETASVLKNATQNSLVILDELGRGTSTFDGYAIAYAVFRHLVETVNCRLLFATHYHALTKEFASHPHVILNHMACSFQTGPGNREELVFLYRLASGACPESYGMQVALMAGIPKHVVDSASRASRMMKKKMRESFRSCEQRAHFSTLHEEWLKFVIATSGLSVRELDDDTIDTLFCTWYEMRSAGGLGYAGVEKERKPQPQVYCP
ncbi:hypothetical protein DM860_004138 [Cuscuta australis]|uniref:DNA mismatch repair proteins mutS family domain-containing protein n=1 Tax=Cuscuta australis TaxID=267555 RepID=A0A328CW28_9ASTE|nr:hypothetical protein DM860_004138 [Cuscuta australis]